MRSVRLVFIVVVFVLVSCGGGSGDSNSPQWPDLSSGTFNCVTLTTTLGDITLALDPVKAPNTVSNFLGYVNAAFYDDTIFHRVIDGFVIQGGGFTQSFTQKATNAPIMNEADNGLSNNRGTIAMARTSDPHSATSQFFINSVDNNFLDYTSMTTSGWGYAVFGAVISGMDVVDNISSVTTGAGGPFTQDVPTTNIVIQTAAVVTCP